jgi:hypothetical protein
VRDHSNSEGERIAVREYLSLTLSMDHDLIDGAPAARFISHLRELIEGGVSTIQRRDGTASDSPANSPEHERPANRTAAHRGRL